MADQNSWTPQKWAKGNSILCMTHILYQNTSDGRELFSSWDTSFFFDPTRSPFTFCSFFSGLRETFMSCFSYVSHLYGIFEHVKIVLMFLSYMSNWTLYSLEKTFSALPIISKMWIPVRFILRLNFTSLNEFISCSSYFKMCQWRHPKYTSVFIKDENTTMTSLILPVTRNYHLSYTFIVNHFSSNIANLTDQ